MLATVTAAFLGVPFTEGATWIQASAAVIAHPLWATAALVAVTLLFGRFYCRVVCPLGVAQSLVNRIFRRKRSVRRVCTRLPVTRRMSIVRWTVVGVLAVLAASGFWPIVWQLDPYAVYGRLIALTMPFALLGAAVLVSAAFGKGRWWCNCVCPLGTLFDALSRFAVFRDKPAAGCANCRACFPAAAEETVAGKEKAAEGGEGSLTRRETLKGVAVIAAAERLTAEKLTDGGFADVSLPGVPKRGKSVMPPGALDRGKFTRKCLACHLCVAACPEKVIKPSLSLASFGQPELDFRHGYCRIACTRCSEVCPSGALVKLQDIMRAHVHMGHAIWKKDLCLRNTIGEKCTACIRKCPVRAVHLVAGFPVIDKAVCIGCGACEHVCPVRPMPAIFVKGFDQQRMVLPMSENDLMEEMKSLIAGGRSIAVARGGVIIHIGDGAGIGPALEALDKNRLAGATVADRIVGRAAAAVFIEGGVRKLYAAVVSEGALALLAKAGVETEFGEKTGVIVNRAGTGRCPMETAVKDIEDVKKMVETLRKAVKK